MRQQNHIDNPKISIIIGTDKRSSIDLFILHKILINFPSPFFFARFFLSVNRLRGVRVY